MIFCYFVHVLKVPQGSERVFGFVVCMYHVLMYTSIFVSIFPSMLCFFYIPLISLRCSAPHRINCVSVREHRILADILVFSWISVFCVDICVFSRISVRFSRNSSNMFV